METHPWIVGADVSGAIIEAVLPRRRVVIITQPTVPRFLVQEMQTKFAERDVSIQIIQLPPTEQQAKTLNTVEEASRGLAQANFSRSDAIVAIGGGVVTDVAGFIAASYHRGVDWYALPTTLLAQVDAAIGGKTGVDLPEGKNLVGAFWMPKLVAADVSVLHELPIEELQSGLGEVIKYALIGNGALKKTLCENSTEILKYDRELLDEIVSACISQKLTVVGTDFREQTGARATLNYGHTLAHALEAQQHFEIRHGFALAIGLIFAAELAFALERIEPAAVAEHRQLVELYGLPTRVEGEVSKHALMSLMQRDKKADGTLTFMLAGPDGIERVVDPPESALNAAFAAVGVQ